MDHSKLLIISAFLLTLGLGFACSLTAASPFDSDTSSSVRSLKTNATIPDEYKRCKNDTDCDDFEKCNYYGSCETCASNEVWDPVYKSCQGICEWDEEWDSYKKICLELPGPRRFTVEVIIALAFIIYIVTVVGVCLLCCFCCLPRSGHSGRERRNQQINQPQQVIVHGYAAPQPGQGQHQSNPGEPQEQKY